MKESALSLQNVYYKYPDTIDWILKNVNIEIPKNSIWLLVGPTGSGKSTLLYLIRGFHKIHGGDFKGKIFVEGENINEQDFYEIGRKHVGWVGQDPSLNLHQLTVREEILSSLIYNNLPWNECVVLADNVICSLGLEKISEKSPTELSGGEMQRVAIAASLVRAGHSMKNDGGILLLDEPDSFLDSKGRKDLVEFIRKLRKTCTVIIATHRFEHYLGVADGITVIDNGKNLLSGTPKEVLYNEITKEAIGCFATVEIARQLKEKSIISSSPLSSEELLSEISGKIKFKCNKKTSINEKIHYENSSNCIEFKDLTYFYPNGNLGVYQLNGNIPNNSITAIIGNNGSGKTTLAKIMLNLLDKYTGTVKLLGRDLRSYSRKELSGVISYITQIPKDMFITDTVRKECEVLPRFQRKQNFKGQVERALKTAGIEKYIDSPIDSLSEGQRRLLSLAATVFMTESPLVVLDEPEFGLDLKIWDSLFQTLLNLRNSGKSIIMLTHWLDATLFCDHIIVMNKGQIVKAGHPIVVYQDKKLLEKIGLEVPSFFPLFCFLWEKGYKITDMSSLIKTFISEISRK